MFDFNATMEKFKRFIELKDAKKEHQAALKEVKKELEPLEQELNNIISQAPELQGQISGFGYTGYPTYRIYASLKDSPNAIEILEHRGLRDFLKYTVHAGQMGSYIKEISEQMMEIPDWAREALNINEQFGVGLRKRG
jgi:hypothetical protein